jgi:hypothetical protein
MGVQAPSTPLGISAAGSGVTDPEQMSEANLSSALPERLNFDFVTASRCEPVLRSG